MVRTPEVPSHLKSLLIRREEGSLMVIVNIVYK